MHTPTTIIYVFVFCIYIISTGVKIQISGNIRKDSIDIWCEKK